MSFNLFNCTHTHTHTETDNNQPVKPNIQFTVGLYNFSNFLVTFLGPLVLYISHHHYFFRPKLSKVFLLANPVHDNSISIL